MTPEDDFFAALNADIVIDLVAEGVVPSGPIGVLEAFALIRWFDERQAMLREDGPTS